MATMDDSALFVDTNVLVYANVTESPLHEQALGAIQAARKVGQTLWISRQVLREYLVTLTRPQAFAALPRKIVLDQVEQFIKQFDIAEDTAAVTEHLIELLADYKLGGKQVHDANIVATMKAYGITTLLTHNVKDFERFGEIIKIEEI